MHEQATDKIGFRLVRTTGFTRWPCHICGGETGMDAVLCEAASPFSDHGTLRICPQCLQRRNFNHLLEQRARGLASQAAAIRSLIGRIEAPSFAEWEREELAADREALGPWDAANAEWARQMRAAGRGDEVGEGKAFVGSDDELADIIASWDEPVPGRAN